MPTDKPATRLDAVGIPASGGRGIDSLESVPVQRKPVRETMVPHAVMVSQINAALNAERRAHATADAELLRAAQAAWHLCQSLLAVRDGATDDLIREIAQSLAAAIEKASPA
jgi:hypothetical protein